MWCERLRRFLPACEFAEADDDGGRRKERKPADGQANAHDHRRSAAIAPGDEELRGEEDGGGGKRAERQKDRADEATAFRM